MINQYTSVSESAFIRDIITLRYKCFFLLWSSSVSSLNDMNKETGVISIHVPMGGLGGV